MALPGDYIDRRQQDRDLKDEEEKLAYEEGHDADIPSNLAPHSSKTHPKDDERPVDWERGAKNDDEPGNGASDDAVVSEKNTSDDDHDPNIVWWDEPADQDPQNPMNWPSLKKWTNVALVSILCLVTPLASSMFAPGEPAVMKTFHSDSQILAAFVVSVYILGFAFGPMVIAPMSEMYGRFPVYMLSNLFFFIFTICCAVSNSVGMLLAFRLLMGLAGSTAITLPGGTVADLVPAEQRGKVMAIMSSGPLIGPVVGPVAGGFLVEAKGWRWVFWVLAVLSGVVSLAGFFFMSETYAPAILARKAARLRKETGNQNLRSKFDRGLTQKELQKRAIVRPIKLITMSPIVICFSLYMSVAYGILYLLFTTFTYVFQETYGFSTGEAGLAFIPIGIGMVVGLTMVGPMSDKVLKAAQARGEAIKPEHRIALRITIPPAVCLPIGLFIYGWTAQYRTHWIVPMIGTVFIGFAMVALFMTIMTYLVDAFTLHAASAIAANTLLRSLFGAFLPLAGLKMYGALGLGWGNSLLGFIALALIVIPVLFRRYGERIRTHPKYQVKL